MKDWVDVLVMIMFVLEDPEDACSLVLDADLERRVDLVEALAEDVAGGVTLNSMTTVYITPLAFSTVKMTGMIRPIRTSGGLIVTWFSVPVIVTMKVTLALRI